ncbi:cell division protein FtsQ/DivIB [Maritalea mediterranea]|uniref:Cell division protein FtsQ n=1 Tax=Maritalea mediterranea TaxID=2909667 RepID=A0ABS9EAZ3_9HYPH|nr:FtsQ-type POTRA domain-containing protein [Maritalea mediterranea]MCF4098925.1 FtsQ-type POTRA domain-containing protein [Maritalea mediterranea]
MRQIRKPQARALALPAPMRQLPALRKTSQLVARGQRAWVLHKRLGVQLVALMLVVLILGVGMINRNHLVNGATLLTERAASLFAQAGLAVSEVSLSGYGLTKEEDLFEAIGLQGNISLVNFDAEAARQRIEALPSIESATIRKIYPNSLNIELVEKTPIAVWRIDGVSFAIDKKGDKLVSLEQGGIDGLPLFIGDGAADDAAMLIEMLKPYELLQQDLLAASRIGDRRWDLIYESGLRIMLPENGVDQAMAKIVELDAEKQLLSRDIEILDFRLKDFIAVRPVDRTGTDQDEANAQ